MRYRTVEFFLFDTCTHKCAYCHFAESGKVLDSSQLNPYRDPEFIDRIVAFFSKRTTAEQKWLITLTGGEPLLTPNLSRFLDGLASDGNKAAFYTALLVGENHPSFQYLLHDGARVIDYLMISFHPEAEDIEDRFFGRLRRLKEAGHNVIFRFIAHPDRLHRLDELSDKCRALDIAFHLSPLASPDYPKAYTEQQRAALYRHVVSISQVIQIENGLDTSRTRCTAGSNIIAIDARTGAITPCISVHKPVLGNLYDDELNLFEGPIACPIQGMSCRCDIHFQQGIVQGADDRAFFEQEKGGFVAATDGAALRQGLLENQLVFSNSLPGIGQTQTARFLALDSKTVKATYEKHREYFHEGYAVGNHSEFKSRQFKVANSASIASTDKPE